MEGSSITGIQIKQAELKDVEALVELGKTSFIESHGHSASKQDIAAYVNEKYTRSFFENDLMLPNQFYYLLYYQEQLVGYSKLVLNQGIQQVSSPALCKLERLYLLKPYYGLQLGYHLFNYNCQLAKEQQQSGMWLYVWKENHRAYQFYSRLGFKIIGSHDFKISNTHANPNFQLFLNFDDHEKSE